MRPTYSISLILGRTLTRFKRVAWKGFQLLFLVLHPPRRVQFSLQNVLFIELLKVFDSAILQLKGTIIMGALKKVKIKSQRLGLEQQIRGNISFH